MNILKKYEKTIYRLISYYDISDDKILVEIFKRINFSGTPQDSAHFKKISK